LVNSLCAGDQCTRQKEWLFGRETAVYGIPLVIASVYGFTNGDQKVTGLSCPRTYAYTCTDATKQLKEELGERFEEALARAQGKPEPSTSIK